MNWSPYRQSSFVGSHTHAGFSTTVWLEPVSGTGIANVVELGDYCGEEDESRPCTEHSSSQELTRPGVVIIKVGSVLGVVGIPHGTRQQAHLRNEEEYPERSCVNVNANYSNIFKST